MRVGDWPMLNTISEKIDSDFLAGLRMQPPTYSMCFGGALSALHSMLSNVGDVNKAELCCIEWLRRAREVLVAPLQQATIDMDDCYERAYPVVIRLVGQ